MVDDDDSNGSNDANGANDANGHNDAHSCIPTHDWTDRSNEAGAGRCYLGPMASLIRIFSKKPLTRAFVWRHDWQSS